MSTGPADPLILFSATQSQWEDYRTVLRAALDAQGVDLPLVAEAEPALVKYIVFSPGSGVQDFSPFTACKAAFSLWAGVEQVAPNQTLKATLCRMVDDGLRLGMIDWVVGHTLRYHLGMDAHIHGQDGLWREQIFPPLARDRRVGILGLGALGMAAAEALAALGFDVAGWSRTPKNTSFPSFSGKAGFDELLRRTEILTLLLPQTAATENTLDAAALAMLPKGAMILNPGRGPLIDDAALLAALDAGHIAHATLDVFREEPLPPRNSYWSHPKVTVTPHIASSTRAETASEFLAENIRRGEAGEPFLGMVDRELGY